MFKALIVYGTRYGATSRTSKDIAEVLRQEGFDVKMRARVQIDLSKDARIQSSFA